MNRRNQRGRVKITPKLLRNAREQLEAQAVNHSANAGGYYQPLPGLVIKEPPAVLVALREELLKPENSDIYTYASQGRDFPDCCGRIAEKLSIVLDGFYDPIPLLHMLILALKGRAKNGDRAVRSVGGLVDVELHETEDEIKMVRREKE